MSKDGWFSWSQTIRLCSIFERDICDHYWSYEGVSLSLQLFVLEEFVFMEASFSFFSHKFVRLNF